MTFLNNGGSAVDAVEIAIKVLEDKEITNAGFGSNLAMDGTVECDATIIDHYGRSGAVGAVGCAPHLRPSTEEAEINMLMIIRHTESYSSCSSGPRTLYEATIASPSTSKSPCWPRCSGLCSRD